MRARRKRGVSRATRESLPNGRKILRPLQSFSHYMRKYRKFANSFLQLQTIFWTEADQQHFQHHQKKPISKHPLPFISLQASPLITFSLVQSMISIRSLALLPLHFSIVVGFVPSTITVRTRIPEPIVDAARKLFYGREYDSAAPVNDDSLYDVVQKVDFSLHRPLLVEDPSLVEFAPTERYTDEASKETLPRMENEGDYYPVATMMQCSAPYIASHMGKVAIFHLPGDILEDPRKNELLSDMALSWLLGMKLVIVVGSRYDLDICEMDDLQNPHECNNMLKVTDEKTMRHVEEDAGFLRTEVERMLNRYMRMHAGVTSSSRNEGYVVSGNFFTAKHFGMLQGTDFQHTGYANEIHTDQIKRVLDSNDIVLLSTVGLTSGGELVNVNGYHLAAAVAGNMKAHKLIYMANEGSVLQKKNEHTPIQEIPLGFSKAILEYHQVKCYNTGFASFDKARNKLEPRAVELLLNLGWAAWGMEHGVQRAHIVNPADGALLEELFTSKNGINTCIYHDEEKQESRDEISQDFQDFLASQERTSFL